MNETKNKNDMTDQCWTLEQADRDAFISASLNPPDPNAALRAAYERFQKAKLYLNSAAKLE